jgi:nucleotide-binding universal stress UspA family protein
MSLKDLLVFVANADTDEPAVALADALAGGHDAHLSATFMIALPDEPLAYEPTIVAGVWSELLARARKESEGERARLEQRFNALSRPVEMRVAEGLGRDIGRIAGVHARYADLAVLARPVIGHGGEMREELVEGVMFHAGRPVLLAPPKWRAGAIGETIVIAWDASREATRAVAEARPFLSRARQVTILTIDAKPNAFGHGEQPGANIAAHLSRRGVSVSVKNADSLGRTIARAIAEECQALNADLLVMGAYRHSRLREMVFGGATRDLLEHAHLPVLMAH